MTTDLSKLRELLEVATPGPYRAHDHNDMARLSEDPEKWIGYAWVGRITKSSEPDGRFDAGWLDLDRRKDASKEYRERASDDAHFVTEALNALPSLLTEIERLTAENFTLAAGACIYPNGDGLIGDERGNAVCAKDATIGRLKSELTTAREALKPFANWAVSRLSEMSKHQPDAREVFQHNCAKITLGDLRRARAVLRSGEKEGAK
jgi:hypothetical protein